MQSIGISDACPNRNSDRNSRWVSFDKSEWLRNFFKNSAFLPKNYLMKLTTNNQEAVMYVVAELGMISTKVDDCRIVLRIWILLFYKKKFAVNCLMKLTTNHWAVVMYVVAEFRMLVPLFGLNSVKSSCFLNISRRWLIFQLLTK